MNGPSIDESNEEVIKIFGWGWVNMLSRDGLIWERIDAAETLNL